MGQNSSCTPEREAGALTVGTGARNQSHILAEFNRLMQRAAVVALEISAALDPVIAHHEAAAAESERALEGASSPGASLSPLLPAETNLG